MMKIKYKIVANYQCYTVCPNIDKLNTWQEIKVGSTGCQNCKYFIKDDVNRKEIHCSCK